MPLERAIEHAVHRSLRAQVCMTQQLLRVSHNTYLDRTVLAEEEEEQTTDMSGYQAWDDVSGSALDPQLVRQARL